jgi:hypothetical protein
MPSVYTNGNIPSVYTDGITDEIYISFGNTQGMVTSGDFTDGNYRGIQNVIAVQ